MSTDSPRNARGVSLARGPALALGAILLVAGLYFLYKLHTFPKLSQFPSGTAHVEGKAFLGIFGLNGWSGELTAVAGGLLLFGAAQHLLAKSTSLVVGVVLAVVAIVALINDHSALGLFAANVWTIILWGGSAALLLVNTLVPRVSRPDTASDHRVPPRRTETTEAVEKSTPAQRAQTEQSDRANTATLIPERGVVRIRPDDTPGPTDQEKGPL